MPGLIEGLSMRVVARLPAAAIGTSSATKSCPTEAAHGWFQGFGKNALGFFKALAFHQSKAWFDENKDLYQRDVLDPMIALLDE